MTADKFGYLAGRRRTTRYIRSGAILAGHDLMIVAGSRHQATEPHVVEYRHEPKETRLHQARFYPNLSAFIGVHRRSSAFICLQKKRPSSQSPAMMKCRCHVLPAATGGAPGQSHLKADCPMAGDPRGRRRLRSQKNRNHGFAQVHTDKALNSLYRLGTEIRRTQVNVQPIFICVHRCASVVPNSC